MSTHFKVLFVGFLLGFLATFVATLGLVVRAIEILKPVLVPALYVWNFVNISDSVLLLAVINGLIYAIIFLIFIALFKRRQTKGNIQ